MMNPNFSRYAPIAVLALVVGVGIYATDSGRLAGEAGAAGCGGAGGADLSALPQSDPAHEKTVLEAGKTPAKAAHAEALAAELIKAGPIALSAVTTHVQDIGCYQPGSALLVEIARTIGTHESVTKAQRQAVAEVLLDAGVYAGSAHQIGAAAVAGKPVYGERVSGAAETLRTGESLAAAMKIEDPEAVEPASAWDCAHRATIDAATLVRFGISDPLIIAERAIIALKALPTTHPLAVSLTKVIIEATGTSPEDRKRLESIVTDERINAIARAVACHAALERGTDVNDLLGGLGTTGASALWSCMLKTSDAKVIELGLQAAKPHIRAEAWNRMTLSEDAVALEGQLREALMAAAQPADNRQASLREEWARFDSVARVFINRPELGKKVMSTIDVQALIDGLPNALRASRGLAQAVARHQGPRAELAAVAGTDVLGAQLEVPESPDSNWIANQLVAVMNGQPSALIGAARPADENQELDRGQDRDSWAARARAAAGGGARDLGDLPVVKGLCDGLVQPGILQLYGPDTTICAEPGTYTGTLELQWPGLRIVGLGEATFDGHVLVAAPSVIWGFTVKGTLLIGELASQSVIASSHLTAGGVSATNDVVMLGNTLEPERVFTSPVGPWDVSEHLPASAQALRAAYTPQQQTSGFTFVPAENLRAVRFAEGDKLPLRDRLGLSHGGMPTGWFPTVTERVGADWKHNLRPVVGAVDGRLNAGVLVPLEIGPWQGTENGVVVTRSNTLGQ